MTNWRNVIYIAQNEDRTASCPFCISFLLTFFPSLVSEKGLQVTFKIAFDI